MPPIVPNVGVPPSFPLMVHNTVVSEAPITLAVKAKLSPDTTVARTGLMVTVAIVGGSLESVTVQLLKAFGSA